MNRRQALQGLVAATFWHGHSQLFAAEHYADPEAADRAMQRWMTLPRASNGMLNVVRFADRYYYLTKRIQWTSDKRGSDVTSVLVPRGFVTDFASIPRIAWSVFPPDGDFTYPAVVHDYLYWSQRTTRAQADEVFRQMMKEFGIPDRVIAIVYHGVRVGGGHSWSENAQLKQSGERRVLRVLPTDPKTRWEIWKKGDVFEAEV